MILSEKIVLVNPILNGNESANYSSILGDLKLEGKTEFLEKISNENLGYTYIIFLVTIFIYLTVIYFMSNIIDALVLGLIGYLFARIVRLRLRYKATFNIGVYALTLPIILNLIYIVVNTFTGFEIKYFQWMYTSISYIYVAVAILMIKTEIINQRIQLIRLQQIQKQVADEAEESETETEETKKEEKVDKKDKEEKEEEGTGGEQPEGSNA